MNQDILSALESMASGFSKGHRKIAGYILSNYDKAAFMTASRMGSAVGVSESTVVRFALQLGYTGYPQMQKALQESMLNRLTSPQERETNEAATEQDVLFSVLRSDEEMLRKTAQMISRKAFADAVSAILKARRIYLIGARADAALVGFMGHYLNFMFDNVHIVPTDGAGEMLERLVNVGAQDAVVAFSFPRCASATVKGAAYCRSVGATVIGLTNSSCSPLCESCDYLLLAKGNGVSIVNSLTAPMSVVNALLAALAFEKEEALTKTLKTLEPIWEENYVYEKQVDANEV